MNIISCLGYLWCQTWHYIYSWDGFIYYLTRNKPRFEISWIVICQHKCQTVRFCNFSKNKIAYINLSYILFPISKYSGFCIFWNAILLYYPCTIAEGEFWTLRDYNFCLKLFESYDFKFAWNIHFNKSNMSPKLVLITKRDKETGQT